MPRVSAKGKKPAPGKKPTPLLTKASAKSSTKAVPKLKANVGKKRARASDSEAAPSKKQATSVHTSLQTLDVYVFGAGEYGELGLGSLKRDGKKPTGVKRPRLNDLLDAKMVGVVQVAVGGMHCVALTHDNQIITWGVNDKGALGRDTTWTPPAAAEDSDSDSDDDTGLNPKETTPTAIASDSFGDHTEFIQVAATESASFVLTAEGTVFGWGQFRGNDGAFGFSTKGATAAAKTRKEDFEPRPVLIPALKNIKSLAAGGNHILALDNKGYAFGWGSGQQHQLGRKITDRNQYTALTPRMLPLPKGQIAQVACGSYHSFAIDINGVVYAWGLNNFGQTGIPDGVGDDGNIVTVPTRVKSLNPFEIKQIKGGNHHSIACTNDGNALVWGRCDDGQAGVPLDSLPQHDLVFDERKNPRILLKPTVVPDIDATFVAAGIDNSFAISTEGKVYSWGFSASYRTGLGTDESIKEATIIENSALLGKKLTFAGCGGQFSVLTGPATK